MVPSVLSHAPTRVSLHRGHLQCAKGAGHYGKENTQKPALGVMAAVCCSLYVYQLRNGERAVALSAEQLIALAALVLLHVQETEDTAVLAANGSVPFIYPGQCFVTGVPKCSAKKKTSR